MNVSSVSHPRILEQLSVRVDGKLPSRAEKETTCVCVLVVWISRLVGKRKERKGKAGACGILSLCRDEHIVQVVFFFAGFQRDDFFVLLRGRSAGQRE